MDRETQSGVGDSLSVAAVEAALKRQLDPEEKTCLALIDRLYRQYCQTRRVNIWDLHALGYPAFHYGTYGESLFPRLPNSKAQFWAWIAYRS